MSLISARLNADLLPQLIEVGLLVDEIVAGVFVTNDYNLHHVFGTRGLSLADTDRLHRFNSKGVVASYAFTEAAGAMLFSRKSLPAYGVADSVAQILTKYRAAIERQDQQLTLVCTYVFRDTENDWRWAKWGKYIGKRRPRCEYLRDEPNIDHVVCYRWFDLPPDCRNTELTEFNSAVTAAQQWDAKMKDGGKHV